MAPPSRETGPVFQFQNRQRIAGSSIVDPEIKAEPHRHEADPEPSPVELMSIPQLPQRVRAERRKQQDSVGPRQRGKRAEDAGPKPALAARRKKGQEQQREEHALAVIDV